MVGECERQRRTGCVRKCVRECLLDCECQRAPKLVNQLRKQNKKTTLYPSSTHALFARSHEATQLHTADIQTRRDTCDSLALTYQQSCRMC